VFGGLSRFVAAALVVGAVFAAPSAALACNGGPSAVNVYKECVPTGGGGKPSSPTHVSHSSASTSVTISPKTALALKHAGKDRRVLTALIHNYGLHRHIPAPASSATAAPTALGSAFDLGSGPTALLIVLAGTAVLLLTGSGMRLWRSRHRA
jgi:hypothetical protein